MLGTNAAGRSQLLIAALCLAATTVMAAEVQIDVSAIWNVDIIVNNGAGLDVIQDPMDSPASLQCMVTQSAAAFLFPPDPDGLPDDGSFAAGPFNPPVVLGYDNSASGDNATQVLGVGGFTFTVPPDMYDEIHLFMSSAEGSATVDVTLTYSDLSTDVTLATVVPDWFNDPADTAAVYRLIDGMDRCRIDTTSYQNSNDPALFGFRFTVDPAKTLTDVTVANLLSGPNLHFLGATAVTSATPGPPATAVPAASPLGIMVLVVAAGVAMTLLLRHRS